MRCPSCKSVVSENAAVCPKCDEVLDPDLLDARPPEPDEDPDRTPPRRQPPPRPKRRTKPTRPVAEPPPPRQRPLVAPDRSIDPQALLEDIQLFVKGLPRADRIALYGTVGVLLACFFPWKETVNEGEVLGLFGHGIVTFALALAALVALVQRARGAVANALPLWVVQLGGIGLGLLWSLVSVRLAWSTAPLESFRGSAEIFSSRPSFGLGAALLAGAVAAGGTVLGLKESS